MWRLSLYLSAVLSTLPHLILSASFTVLSFRFCFFRLRAVATSLSWRFFCSLGLFGVRLSGMPFSPEEGCSVSLSGLSCWDGCSKACSSSTGSSYSMAGFLSRRGLGRCLRRCFDCFSGGQTPVPSPFSSLSLPLGVSTMYTS